MGAQVRKQAACMLRNISHGSDTNNDELPGSLMLDLAEEELTTDDTAADIRRHMIGVVQNLVMEERIAQDLVVAGGAVAHWMSILTKCMQYAIKHKEHRVTQQALAALSNFAMLRAAEHKRKSEFEAVSEGWSSEAKSKGSGGSETVKPDPQLQQAIEEGWDDEDEKEEGGWDDEDEKKASNGWSESEKSAWSASKSSGKESSKDGWSKESKENGSSDLFDESSRRSKSSSHGSAASSKSDGWARSKSSSTGTKSSTSEEDEGWSKSEESDEKKLEVVVEGASAREDGWASSSSGESSWSKSGSGDGSSKQGWGDDDSAEKWSDADQESDRGLELVPRPVDSASNPTDLEVLDVSVRNAEAKVPKDVLQSILHILARADKVPRTRGHALNMSGALASLCNYAHDPDVERYIGKHNGIGLALKAMRRFPHDDLHLEALRFLCNMTPGFRMRPM